MNAENDSFNHLLHEIRFHGTPHYFMLHELAHSFSKGGPLAHRPWTGELETVAEFLTSYALEQGGFEFGYPTKTVGTQHRHNLLKTAMEHLAHGTIEPFSYARGSAYDLYMLGLVDKTGWNTLKNAVQSYHLGTYTPTKIYDDSPSVQAAGKYQIVYPSRVHEFFDRVAYFHDVARKQASTDPTVWQTIPPSGRNLTGEQVLRSLPDGGQLLNRYFTVKTKTIAPP